MGISAESSLSRDGLRATCPYFVQRCSYRGTHYIECKHADFPLLRSYVTAAMRNRDYLTKCVCGGYCGLRATTDRHVQEGFKLKA